MAPSDVANKKGTGFYVSPEGIRRCDNDELISEVQVVSLQAQVAALQLEAVKQDTWHKKRIETLQVLQEANQTLQAQNMAARVCITDIMKMVRDDPTVTAQTIEARIRETFTPLDASENPPQENPDADRG